MQSSFQVLIFILECQICFDRKISQIRYFTPGCLPSSGNHPRFRASWRKQYRRHLIPHCTQCRGYEARCVKLLESSKLILKIDFWVNFEILSSLRSFMFQKYIFSLGRSRNRTSCLRNFNSRSAGQHCYLPSNRWREQQKPQFQLYHRWLHHRYFSGCVVIHRNQHNTGFNNLNAIENLLWVRLAVSN